MDHDAYGSRVAKIGVEIPATRNLRHLGFRALALIYDDAAGQTTGKQSKIAGRTPHQPIWHPGPVDEFWPDGIDAVPDGYPKLTVGPVAANQLFARLASVVASEGKASSRLQTFSSLLKSVMRVIEEKHEREKVRPTAVPLANCNICGLGR